MLHAVKQKFKRLILMGSIFALFSLIGISFGLVSIVLQNKAQDRLPLILKDPNLHPFKKTLLSVSENGQKTYLVLGIIFGVMGGFCFAAAITLKRQSS